MVFLDRTDKTDEWMYITNAYRLARDGGGGLSGQRRFVPHASTRLTTNLHLSAQKMVMLRGEPRLTPRGRSGDRPYRGCAYSSTQRGVARCRRSWS
jgi:hypothetical protein